MAKKSKKDKEAKKARAELKNKKNQAKSQQKQQKKQQKLDSDDEDDGNIEEILENFKKEQENYEKINIESVEKPSIRNNGSIISSTTKKELLLFGGEHTSKELQTTKFYNDLYTFSPDNNQWKRITSQNSPMPRSSAAMAAHPSGIALLNGGEFSSPKQSTFYHYSDTWILDLTTKEWTKIEGKVKPVGRSGHRITTWKNYFILFGGFKDLGHSTTYYNDVWLFDITTYKWKQVEFPKNHTLPDARSGHSLIPTSEGCIVYGGYCKIKAKKGLQKGKLLSGCWNLKMKADVEAIRWERRRKQGFQPSPRVGCSMAYHKGRGILFGGVYDFDETEESLESIFYNDLFTYNIESNRWFNVTLKKRSNATKTISSTKNKSSKEKERELQDLLNQILEKNNLKPDDEEEEESSDIFGSDDEDDEEQKNKIDIKTVTQLPHPRFNATTTVIDDMLYIYGGAWEFGEIDYSIDSFYSIDLNKLDGVNVYWEDLNEIETAKELGEQGSEDEDEDDFEEDEEDGEEEVEDTKLIAEDVEDEKEEEEEEYPEMEIPDPRPWLPHPKAFESLRAFYLREGPAFLEWAISNNRHTRGKLLKQKSFELCQDRWWERRDQISIEEDKLEEIGVVGDVVERDTSKAVSKRR
ncbi:hypothetical protein KAFR_0B06500 [Kazachstania africana CBS 2517]|uniref:DUF4110 domain-containing protein n=1 Tax=Kazachstania africana (strain ATCC 22294 / BCRC 22015 / CBS 2517 / CECT 1963 / NBRC 1671 / NRRL Y-8276) TaxID=1071382 RepID=H2ARE6_KAZAF|nr:hypothetical protein KAFR_0B06500 [Kazachstania africana CBS 2517]CCF56946.1 hypothetical protein KAFR_0B06500 [Kazachstania africana CBS 2517]